PCSGSAITTCWKAVSPSQITLSSSHSWDSPRVNGSLSSDNDSSRFRGIGPNEATGLIGHFESRFQRTIRVPRSRRSTTAAGGSGPSPPRHLTFFIHCGGPVTGASGRLPTRPFGETAVSRTGIHETLFTPVFTEETAPFTQGVDVADPSNEVTRDDRDD